jgi:hypothetical protein
MVKEIDAEHPHQTPSCNSKGGQLGRRIMRWIRKNIDRLNVNTRGIYIKCIIIKINLLIMLI